MKLNFLKIKLNVFSIALLFVLFFLSNLPYFNIILSTQLLILIALSLIISILNLSTRYIFLISFLVIISSIPTIIIGQEYTAEKIAFYGYTIMVLGFIRSVYRNIFKNDKGN